MNATAAFPLETLPKALENNNCTKFIHKNSKFIHPSFILIQKLFQAKCTQFFPKKSNRISWMLTNKVFLNTQIFHWNKKRLHHRKQGRKRKMGVKNMITRLMDVSNSRHKKYTAKSTAVIEFLSPTCREYLVSVVDKRAERGRGRRREKKRQGYDCPFILQTLMTQKRTGTRLEKRTRGRFTCSLTRD